MDPLPEWMFFPPGQDIIDRHPHLTGHDLAMYVINKRARLWERWRRPDEFDFHFLYREHERKGLRPPTGPGTWREFFRNIQAFFREIIAAYRLQRDLTKERYS